MKRFKLTEDRMFDIAVYIILTLITLAVLLPILYVYGSSIAERSQFVTRGFFIIPREITFDAYIYLINNEIFVRSFKNAVIITVFGTVINMVFTTLMAYALSKKWLPGRSFINFLVLFSMLFSGGMIPLYLIVNGLGLLDSYWALWLTSAISPFYLIVMRGLFGNIPRELEEAARMDGCGEWRLFFTIALPLAKPALATFTIFYIVAHWNSYFDAVLYLHDQSRMPLQVMLRRLIIQDEDLLGSETADILFSPAVPMAAIVITITPLLIIFPFFQKYFNKGFLLGSVKD
ncbi:carbohydrate ABC transporter permease [Alkalihalobacillus sp. LMS39]|uniref:carbohydrate ABC transporter permease n=1 Tax=Alkalihalobacillus sp. LMS39 TaxID=2924032 RepID=UPI001FB20DF8|nr:carbohydrate ABC transporter permease [Alkalihalobacillus sp. LMS39]UOE94824.1 carbohydrate ABC transporter permease [Alkalihalobacillus sp. LMS39]